MALAALAVGVLMLCAATQSAGDDPQAEIIGGTDVSNI